MVATLPEITALLGEPRFHWSDPAPWIELERELGIEFPADFREFVDAYGSIEINRELYLKHPMRPSSAQSGREHQEGSRALARGGHGGVPAESSGGRTPGN